MPPEKSFRNILSSPALASSTESVREPQKDSEASERRSNTSQSNSTNSPAALCATAAQGDSLGRLHRSRLSRPQFPLLCDERVKISPMNFPQQKVRPTTSAEKLLRRRRASPRRVWPILVKATPHPSELAARAVFRKAPRFGESRHLLCKNLRFSPTPE